MKIAIIPARGGSKRLPGKNIKILSGKPMIAWSIEAALNSTLFDLVLVSTDCREISDIAEHYGAVVPCLRPATLASDAATTNDVISHMVEVVEARWGGVDTITLLQPTSPLRTTSNIVEAHQLYEEMDALSVISVCEMEHPVQLCNKLPADHSMSGFIQEKYNVRSQELESYYRINGAIYIFDRVFVGSLTAIYGDKSYAYIMRQDESIDIDSLLDFDIAEIIMTRR
ncbi:acylneuraminate cytidylyltransferase family protein [Citrobacter sp. Awk 4]|uniref:acylneuraminate cytidylyltransferase family protein n=1 Tax=Citrobacter sp. Awk 4 TaxID=2963955 RepID=UPI002303CF19|nr:acylneuraminate cytidylyltransferase family protein [Citrobacter sp. Awk 4]MDA8481157.1 acylneuraminate cytidylyltransferase family protein [Citrobacter sp. Awk 4]